MSYPQPVMSAGTTVDVAAGLTGLAAYAGYLNEVAAGMAIIAFTGRFCFWVYKVWKHRHHT